jgi:hypothetical protein
MSLATPADNGRFSGIDARRSTRLEHAIPLIIMGKDKLGELSQEATSAVSLNLHGCRFPSLHDYPVETWVDLRVTEPNGGAKSPLVRARVRSIHGPKTAQELHQIGVEFEAPSNVWGIPIPPEDWRCAPSAAADRAKDPGLAKPERVVITKDQLVKALQGKLQVAAEKAVAGAFATQLDGAVKKALSKIAEFSRASLRQTQEFTRQHLDSLVNSSQEEVLTRLTGQLGEVQSRWAEEQSAYRSRAEEIAGQLEKLVTETQQSFTDAQAFIGTLAHELGPQFQSLHTRLDEYAARAAEDFEVLVTSASARHLVQLKENALKMTQETSAQLEARAAEVASQLTKAAGELETHMRVRLDENIAPAAKAFETAAARVSDQQLVRLTEGLKVAAREAAMELETRTAEAREASAQLEAHVTQTRLFLQSQNAVGGASEEHLKRLVNAAREEILSCLEKRLEETRSRWEERREAYRSGADELGLGLEKLAGEAGLELGDKQGFIEKAARELEPQMRTRLEETVGRAREEFEAAAARVSDRQLVRLMEATRMETREASSQLEAQAAEARAMIQTTAHGILDEFRRQAEVQIDLAISEATQRTKSSLASLEAENRNACEARRRTLEDEVARTGELSSQEFRTGIRAFLYFCLVAAANSAHDRPKATLDGLVKDHEITVAEIAGPSDSTEQRENHS